MKIFKFILVILFIALLGSCDSNKNDNDKENKIKYEVGTAQVFMWTDSKDNNWMKVAIPVTNTGNTNIFLYYGLYDVQAKSGSLLSVENELEGSRFYLKPGETGYYFGETRFNFTEAEVNIIPNLLVKKVSNEVIRYSISNVSITDTSGRVTLEFKVKNDTLKNTDWVYGVALLFDDNDKLITILYEDKYFEEYFITGETASFVMPRYEFENKYRSFSANDVARYEIYAYPDQVELDWL